MLRSQTPHGPILLKDGPLMQFGRRFEDSLKKMFPPRYWEHTPIMVERSTDGGSTWGFEVRLSGSKNSDLGHPATLELDGGILPIVYCQHPPSGGKPCIMPTKWRLRWSWDGSWPDSSPLQFLEVGPLLRPVVEMGRRDAAGVGPPSSARSGRLPGAPRTKDDIFVQRGRAGAPKYGIIRPS